MNKKEDLIFDYWKRFVNSATGPIKDWLIKESDFLRRNIAEGSFVLDVGVGYGRNIEVIAKKATKLVGIDKSPFLLKKIEDISNQYPNVELFCEDANKMSFEDNFFDYVVCLGNTFGDFGKEKTNVLEEMKRVCKEKGKIFVSVYSEEAIPFRIKAYEKIGIRISKIKKGSVFTSEGLRLEQFTKEELKKIFNKVELKTKITRLNKISYMVVAWK